MRDDLHAVRFVRQSNDDKLPVTLIPSLHVPEPVLSVFGSQLEFVIEVEKDAEASMCQDNVCG
jgi:hypothetical protein